MRLANTWLTRLALSLCFTLSAGLAFVPLGCGGSDTSLNLILPGNGTPEVPERTAKELARCLRHHSASFPPVKDDTYAIDFAVKLSRRGEVTDLDIRRSTLPGHDVETCMGGALLEMTLPLRPMAMELRYRAPKGPVAPPARELFAQPAMALSPVSLAPVIIAGLGIILVVTVVIYLTSEPPAVDCKKVKQDCIEKCSDTALPTPDYGVKFFRCVNACMKANGC